MYYVYELSDETGEVFYVGKGKGRRMYQHKFKAKWGEQTPRADKIREILARGGEVRAVAVMHTKSEKRAYREECRLIAKHGRDRLTNRTAGGCGVRGLPPATLAKLSEGRKGIVFSPETIERMRQAKLGVPRSATTRAKIARAQRKIKKPWAKLPRSAEHRAKLSTFKGRKHTPETIAKMRAAKIGHRVSKATRRKISETKRSKSPSQSHEPSPH